jgi:glycosyltransferase involved in cell wall biosynthesis
VAAPRVSIVIPTYNRAGEVTRAVESALAQDYPHLEVIVCDNASADDTPRVMAAYTDDPRLTYVRNGANIGMVGNWRKGVFEHATGDWFLILSDDDHLTEPTYLSRAAALIEAHPDLVLIYADAAVVDERRHRTETLVPPFDGVVDGVRVFLSRGTVRPQDFALCNVLFRRDRAVELDAFSNPDNVSCDSELFLKLCLLGPVGVIHVTAAAYRKHDTNLISRVNRDWRLLVHNTDYALGPYLMARRTGAVDPAALEAWADRLVVPWIVKVLLAAEVGFRDHRTEIEAALAAKSPEMLERARAAVTPGDRVKAWHRRLKRGLARAVGR